MVGSANRPIPFVLPSPLRKRISERVHNTLSDARDLRPSAHPQPVEGASGVSGGHMLKEKGRAERDRQPLQVRILSPAPLVSNPPEITSLRRSRANQLT